MTLDDVARRAEVSRATASRAVNGLPNVSDESRAQVLSAVEALGYAVNPQGRALATGRNQDLGLLLCDLGDREELSFARAVLDAAADAELRVFVAESRDDAARRQRAVAKWRADRVDAVILFPDPRADGQPEWERELGEFLALGGRVVHIDTKDREWPSATLLLEEFDAAADLGEVLARAGHRRFAVVGRDDQDLSGDRSSGFQMGVSRAGGNNFVFSSIVLRGCESGADLRAWWSKEGAATDCVFAVDVDLANVLISWLREQGVGVPEEVSVATFRYSGCANSDGPITAATMPMDVAAARTLKLVANEIPNALRVAGTCFLGDTTRAAHSFQQAPARLTEGVSEGTESAWQP